MVLPSSASAASTRTNTGTASLADPETEREDDDDDDSQHGSVMDDDSDAGSDILGYVLGRAEKQKPSGLQPKAKDTSATAKMASATLPRKQASMLPTVVKPAKVRSSSSSSKKAAVDTSAKGPLRGHAQTKTSEPRPRR